MANEEHVRIIKLGVDAWNNWRNENPAIEPDLSKTDLIGANLSKAYLSRVDLTGANLIGADLSEAAIWEAGLSEANLSGANLHKADLSGAYLSKTNLSKADLSEADLYEADLYEADLSGANLLLANLAKAYLSYANGSGANLWGAQLFNAKLVGANFSGTNLSTADLREADLSEANLSGANLNLAFLESAYLMRTNLKGAILLECYIHGISAWNVEVNEETKQSSLIITRNNEPKVTVDDLEVAQFIYLLLNRQKIRNVIDVITSKTVLILGRFTPERKIILDAMANELRNYDLIPIIFDFERASSRDFTETIKTLAGLSLFVIADITHPKSAPLELQATIPDYQIPFVPIIEEGEEPFSMFADLEGKYFWVLKPLKYPSWDHLKQVFKVAIIDEAYKMHKELLKIKAQGMETRSVEDYLKKYR